MSELKIKFEKDYPKLQGLKKAKLLQVIEMEFGKLSSIFLSYDAKQADGEYYKFGLRKEDKVMCLVFGDPETYRTFITVRRWTPEKESYYQGNSGEWFEIVRGGE